MSDAIRVDLNKKTDETPIKHAFFFCPKCNELAETIKEDCHCSVQSVIMQMSCKKCQLTADWTHWEVH